MQLRIICLLFAQGIFLYDGRNLVIATPIIGQNVRSAQPNEFPSMVGILRRTQTFDLQNDLMCGGVLVSREDILTAEHCIEDESLTGVLISIGSNDVLQARRYYPSWWISFEQWSTQLRRTIRNPWNDIAMIKLTEAVPDNVPSAALSPLKPEQLYGRRVDFTGWGVVNNGSVVSTLQAASVTVIPANECSARLSQLTQDNMVIHKRILCTVADPYILMHQGDSGGPVFYQGAVIAVSSGTCPFPHDYFDPSKINLQFAVSYYAKFIKFIIEH